MRTFVQNSLLLAVWAATVILATGGPAKPTADVQFSDAYRMVQLADSAYEKEEWAAAKEFYTEARDIYVVLRNKFPDWQPNVVEFRIRYCTRRLDLLPAQRPEETRTAARLGPASELAVQSSDDEATEASLKAAKALDILIDAARRQLIAGNVKSARDGLISAMRISPDHATIRLLLGLAQCQLGQFSDAATILDNMIEDDPTNAQAYLYRGTARIGLGRIDDAVADIEQSIRLNPASHEAHYDLAQALLLKTPPDTAAAQKTYRKAIELGGSPDRDLETRLKPASRPR